MNSIKEVWNYRDMIFMLTHKELRGRYKASVLGFLWTFVNPLLQLLVYTLVFSTIMRLGIEKYYLFLFVALIPWIAMATSITDGTVSIVQNTPLVTKIYFPRQVLPISAVTTCFANMMLCMIVVIIVCAISNGINAFLLWYLIPITILEAIIALGIVLITAGINVYVRDVEHILGIVVMAWQFLSPIMYSVDMVPDKLLWIFNLNPMTPIIVAFRDVLYYKQAPDMHSLIFALLFGCVILVIGWTLFNKLQKRFAEEL